LWTFPKTGKEVEETTHETKPREQLDDMDAEETQICTVWNARPQLLATVE
jgi:hypothetical protein